MKHLFISILNYNGNKDTEKCLDSIGKSTYHGFDVTIVVVDNASKIPFKAASGIAGKIPVIVLRQEANTGFTGGHNIGMQYALDNKADYVMILNNDVEIDKNMIQNLYEQLSKDETIGAVVPKIYFAKGSEYHKDKYKQADLGKVIWYAGGILDWANVMAMHRGVDEIDHGQYDKLEETDFATGCCMLMPKEVLQKVGLFDNQYFLYLEDNDLNMRMKKAGYKIVYVPSAKLWHINAASGGGSGSKLQDYYITRNRMIFGMRYAPLRAKIALIRQSLSLLKNGREWQKKGITDFYRRKFGKGSFGI